MDRNEIEDLMILTNAFFENLQIDSCEYGGIGLDSKRPFGNSSVTLDIMEMIGVEPEFNCRNCGAEYSEEQRDYADQLYHEKLIPFLKKQWEGNLVIEDTLNES